MLGCGANGSCGCSQMGGLEDRSYPRVAKILVDYAEREIAAGRPFYVSPDFNSKVLAGDGNLGFIAQLVQIAQAAAAVIGAKAALKASKGSSAPQIATELKQSGVPSEIAPAVAQASILDAFGTQNKPLVIAGLAGLALLLFLRR